MRILLFCLLLSIALPAAADGAACDGGTVFLDGNGNGHRDAREPGLPGVAVSDGERIVRSDRHGRYVLASGSGHTRFLIKPAGFSAGLRADGLPDTWMAAPAASAPSALRQHGSPAAARGCKDFALQRQRRRPDAPLSVLVFGDPQPKSLIDVGYYQRDIVAPLQGQPGASLGISLGDLVNDQLSLYPALKAVDATLGIPWLHAPGNHDLDFDAGSDEASLSSFRHAFGPDTYAWEEAQANFIVLDDVIYQPGQSPAYVGGLREQQFAFLQAYLDTASKQRLLVLALHIPLFDVPVGVETFRHGDRERLFALLRPFPHVLLLSAHTHNQQHYYHGAAEGWHGLTPLHEYNVGAACGAYWSGIKDADGIPASTMSDGTPNGYARLNIADGRVAVRWFAARAPADYQMALHAPRVLRRGAYPAYGVYANVFMGDDTTPVQFRVDDGDWRAMRRVSQADPDLLAENARDDAAPGLRGVDRSPEAAVSTHLWRGTLPTDLALGEHTVWVRAGTAGPGQALASTRYRLDEASP